MENIEKYNELMRELRTIKLELALSKGDNIEILKRQNKVRTEIKKVLIDMKEKGEMLNDKHKRK